MRRLAVLCTLAAVVGCGSQPASGVYDVSFSVILDDCSLFGDESIESETWGITFGEGDDVTVDTSDEPSPECMFDGDAVECSQQLEESGLSYQRDIQLTWESEDRFVGNADSYVTCVDDCGDLNDVLPCTTVVSMLGSLP